MRKNQKFDDIFFKFNNSTIKAPNPKSSTNTFQRNNLKWTYPEFLEFINSHYVKEPKWMGKIWLFYREVENDNITGEKEPPLCSFCHKNYCHFNSYNIGYNYFCTPHKGEVL